jgi:hypothetical protein
MKMSRAVMAAIFLGLAALGVAEAAPPATPAIASPDIRQTWPQGNLRGWSFRLGPDDKSFTAVVTYSNELIADRANPQRQEDFFFNFPNVLYDPKRGGFVWKNPAGGPPVVIAWRSSSGGSTELAKGVIVLVWKHGGRLAATIRLAPSGATFSTTLAEVASPDPWMLQSLIQH